MSVIGQVDVRRAAWGAVALVVVGACDRDVRLAGREIPHVEVRAVTHYGMTLDRDATPKEVAYVALRAMRDDFLAADEGARKEALRKQFDVCAANVIEARNRTSIARDEHVYNVVYHWTPTVSHYIGNFDLDWVEAREQMFVRGLDGGSGRQPAECEVLMELQDPGGDPDAQVVLIVWMAKDNGFWRVVRLGFDNKRRSIGEESRLSNSE